MEIRIQNKEGIAAAAREFVRAMGGRRIFAFYGGMGAGKTTFIKAVCEVLGVEDTVTSPTFAIVNEYRIGRKPRPDAEGPVAAAASPSSVSGAEGEALPVASLPASGSVFHFDFYRIRNLREAQDIGCEEYFYSGAPCFIEWPELVEPLLPEDTVGVHIDEQADGSRIVSVAGGQ